MPFLGSRLYYALAALSVLTLGPLALRGSDGTEMVERPDDFVGTQSCTSASCHGAPHGRNPQSSLGRESLIWLGADPAVHRPLADPHSQAAQRMREPRFQEVLRRASGKDDGTSDPDTITKCAACHDPQASMRKGEASAEPLLLILGNGSAGASPSHYAFSCETCHGGAQRWMAVHYERDISRVQLLELGMIDTKDLIVRARLCATCHVGSADHDMNHDMLAAGHPPLRFELASYEALLPRKHWDDRPRRRTETDYEVKLWAAGRIASAEAKLELLATRAKRAADAADSRSAAPWPELAEANCFVCHQPLRAKDAGPRVITGQPHGMPWQTWNTALSPANTLGQLRSAMEASLSPEPTEIARLAQDARARVIDRPSLSSITSVNVLRQLATSNETSTWDELCQRLAALAAVERSLRDRGAIDSRMSKAWHERAEQIAVVLRFGSPDRQWPQIFREPNASLDDVRRELAALRDELQITAAATSPRTDSEVAP